ncbi:unnamed protein product [Menidia menidia]|uniref:(Atlantic silverside) hypothetical protein n=1 Tax=Menidia menidia TaxID=238744 RepID=A0A8S4BK64_9TELE|nr:unnamed protein product [Menidia menidia]
MEVFNSPVAPANPVTVSGLLGRTHGSRWRQIQLSSARPVAPANPVTVSGLLGRTHGSRWRQILLSSGRLKAKERLFAVRLQFISGVSDSVLNQLLDKLLQQGALSNEEMQRAKTKLREDKARDAIDTVMRKGFKPGKTLIAALREVDPSLSRELNLW